MARPLPPLTALRAFEAVAATLSVKQAAATLNVTPSAVSHQIRGLEAALGVELFRRVGRRLVLTEAGRALRPGLSDGFARIAAAVTALEASLREGPLTVSMVSTFALHWFMPRLPHFLRRHPEIELRLSTTLRPVSFEHEGVDAAVRFGRGAWHGLRADRLFDLAIVPVCSPALLAGEVPLDQPADLRHHTLLVAEARPDDWRTWLQSLDLADLRAARVLTFETTSFALQAAAEGAGVAIVARELVAGDLALGRLAAPFEHAVPLAEAYYLVCPEAWADRPKIAAFRTWILEQANVPR